jgi:hypothetical protein
MEPNFQDTPKNSSFNTKFCLLKTRNRGTSVSVPFGSVPVITDGTELPRCNKKIAHSIANFDNILPYFNAINKDNSA